MVKVGSCVFLGVHRQLEVPGPKYLLESWDYLQPLQPTDVKHPAQAPNYMRPTLSKAFDENGSPAPGLPLTAR